MEAATGEAAAPFREIGEAAGEAAAPFREIGEAAGAAAAPVREIGAAAGEAAAPFREIGAAAGEAAAPVRGVGAAAGEAAAPFRGIGGSAGEAAASPPDVAVAPCSVYEYPVAKVDAEQARAVLCAGLPVRARWLLHGVPLAFDFTLARSASRPLGQSEVVVGPVRPAWASLWVFGEDDYADGGGAHSFLVIDPGTGEVRGLDGDRASTPLYGLNSDVQAFVATFDAFDRALRSDDLDLPPERELLRPMTRGSRAP